jgi:hypothetical protein
MPGRDRQGVNAQFVMTLCLATAFRILLAAVAPACLYGQLRAGAAKTDITPDLATHGPVYMAGFDHNRVATGVHDPLWARCIALLAGRKPLVVCAVDSIGLFSDDIERIRRKLPTADVVVAATHVHEAPDTMGMWGPAEGTSGINEQHNTLVIDRTAQAAAAAIKALRPAAVTLARSQSPELDGFIADDRPPELHDSELVVLSIADEMGNRIATAVNWANHPETLGSKNTLITADYPHYLIARLEEQLGGMGVLWNGAVGGMQSPLHAAVKDPKSGKNAPDGSFRKAELIGRRVADLAIDAIQGETPPAVSQVAFLERRIAIPVANPKFQLAEKAGLFGGRKKIGADGSTQVPAGVVRLSGREGPLLEIALVPGELFPELSVGGVARYEGADFPDAPIEPAIKPMMTAPYRMLIGLAGDEIGYIIPKREWDEKEPWLQKAPRPWYGEANSIGPETAPRIAEAFRSLLGGR